MAFIRENLDGFAEMLAELVMDVRTAMKKREWGVGNRELERNEKSENDPLLPTLHPPLPRLYDLAAALESHNAVEIDGIMEELSDKELDLEAKETLAKISDHVLMAEYSDAMVLVRYLLDTTLQLIDNGKTNGN
jgi:hypothetical protein